MVIEAEHQDLNYRSYKFEVHNEAVSAMVELSVARVLLTVSQVGGASLALRDAVPHEHKRVPLEKTVVSNGHET